MLQISANDVNAAEAIANPFPVAAVVFLPNLKYLYALLLLVLAHSFRQYHLHYQQIGPNASIANCIAVVAIIADAANATP